MAKVIVIANQKGGVGKTTTAQALAASLKRRGHKTLAIDMDPQGNLSDSVGADTELATIYEVLKKEASAQEAVQELSAFDIIPSDIVLASADQALAQMGKEYLLKEALEPLLDSYSYIVIDTPPALNVLTVNALVAAHEAIVPTNAGIFSAKGIKELAGTVELVKKYFNSGLVIRGVLLTRYNPRLINSRDMRDLTAMIAEHIGARLFESNIRINVAVEESQAKKSDLYSHAPNSAAAYDYEAFVSEWLALEDANG